jgi:TRAP transporter 4TM/12TM fusion protein
MFWIALVLCVFQLTFAVWGQLIELQARTIHVSLVLVLILLGTPAKRGKEGDLKLLLVDVGLACLVVAANASIGFDYLRVYMFPGLPEAHDLILGPILLVCILEAARRSMGWVMPIIVLVIFCYATFVAPYMPGIWQAKSLGYEFLVGQVYSSSSGLYGAVTGYSATFIAVFLIFGALLERTGGGGAFKDIALALAGRAIGGPAKVAVVSSALFGSISGSAIANVAATGVYTIPLMKKLGYSPRFAGAVETIASTGGVVMPPVMGVIAFIMAEWLGISYIKVIGYAAIPAFLFYLCVMFGVHFEAVHLRLPPVPAEEIPSWQVALQPTRLLQLVLPIVVLLWYIGRGYALITAGFWACVAVIVVSQLTLSRAVGLKARVSSLVDALLDGGMQIARVGCLMACVSMLVNVLGISGVAPKLGSELMSLGEENVSGALVVAAILPILLGMAVPTAPAYILSAALVAPVLVKLGLDIVAVHMFLVYFCALSPATPPMCAAAYVAAGIAKAHWFGIAVTACKLGAVAFLVPFFFVLEPALLGRAAATAVVLNVGTATVGCIAIAYALSALHRTPPQVFAKPLIGVGGVCLAYPDTTASIVGFLLVSIGVLFLKLSLRRQTTGKARPA